MRHSHQASSSSTLASAVASTTPASAEAETGRDIKIGLVSPKTGGLAPFAIADVWWTAHALEATKDGVVMGDGKKRKFQILTGDSQSDSNRAAQVAGDLILNSKVDMVMASGSPDTVTPVGDQAEANSTPGLFNFSPWQALFFRDVTPKEGYKWIYGHCLGSEQTMMNYIDMYNQVPNNKKVGMLFANDADAQAWMAPNAAPKILTENGFQMTVPTYYTPGSEDFTQQINAFKKDGCDLVCGCNNPPEFINFWKQAYQQGFRPKLVSTGKALLFPSVLEAMGTIAFNMVAEMSWHPHWPFKDSLTGMTNQQMADDFEAKGNGQWTQTIGQYSKFEWAVWLYKHAKNPEDKESIAEILPQSKLDCVNGPIDFTTPIDPNTVHPVKNNMKPTYAGGQWVKGAGKYMFDFVECSDKAAPGTKVEATVQPMSYT